MDVLQYYLLDNKNINVRTHKAEGVGIEDFGYGVRLGGVTRYPLIQTASRSVLVLRRTQ